MNSFILLTFVFLIAGTVSSANLKGGLLYRLQNREDPSVFLTAQKNTRKGTVYTVAAFSDDWRGAPEQKWRLETIDSTNNLYELKPAGDEDSELSQNYDFENLVSVDTIRWYNSIGISTSQRKWKIITADAGFSELQNYKTNKCLSYFGKGRQIGLSTCDNTHKVQWFIQQI